MRVALRGNQSLDALQNVLGILTKKSRLFQRESDLIDGSAPPLAAETASLIKSETPALRSQIRGFRTNRQLGDSREMLRILRKKLTSRAQNRHTIKSTVFRLKIQCSDFDL